MADREGLLVISECAAVRLVYYSVVCVSRNRDSVQLGRVQ